jgi:hypothetical protein
MNEAEWFASTDPAAMLVHVEGSVSARKLRLFAVSCVRQVWDGKKCERCQGKGSLPYYYGSFWTNGAPQAGDEKCPDCYGTGRVGGLTDERSRRAVEVAERYADEGGDYYRDVMPAVHDAYAAWSAHRDGDISFLAWAAVGHSIADLFGNNWFAVSKTFGLLTAQAAILRDIVNPFRPVTLGETCESCGGLGECSVEDLDGRVCHRGACNTCGGQGVVNLPPWLTENVVNLARTIYDGNLCPVSYRHLPHDHCDGSAAPRNRTIDPGHMAILADALEEAGCTDDAILAHCRGLPECEPGMGRCDYHPALHVRGCWVVDLILGKS